MFAQFYQPQPALQHLVHNIMVSGSHVPLSLPSAITPFPPLSQHALYFYLKDPISAQFFGDEIFTARPKCMIIGPQLLRVNIKMGHENQLVRIGFQPGGLHRLVKFSMHEILDYACDATAIFGTGLNEIVNKLQENMDKPAEQKNIVERFLLSFACREQSPFVSAIKHLVHYNGNVGITQLASQSGLSPRQFERKCQEYLGLPPKLFARLARFSKAYRLHQNFPNSSWTTIAYQCGYFDQMHFIRDFKEFAGVTPTFMQQELTLTPFRLQTDLSF